MPSILEFLRTRRTCRRFLPKAVPDAVLREALEAARIASCGSNRQTLKYALVQSPGGGGRAEPACALGRLPAARAGRARPRRDAHGVHCRVPG